MLLTLLYFLISSILFSYVSLSNAPIRCAHEKVYNVLITDNFLNRHFYSEYVIKKINQTCINGDVCISHNNNKDLHQVVQGMSKIWIDPNLRDEMCSDRVGECVKTIESKFHSVSNKILTPASYVLMCIVSAESSSDQCVMSAAEMIQYARLHVESNTTMMFGSEKDCEKNFGTNTTVCINLQRRYKCLKYFCTDEGFSTFVTKVYPNFVNFNSSNVVADCSILESGISRQKITINIIKKVNIRAAVLGLCTLILLCLAAVLISLHCAGKFPTSNMQFGKQYIRLKTNDGLSKATSNEDDLAEETEHLLPERKT